VTALLAFAVLAILSIAMISAGRRRTGFATLSAADQARYEAIRTARRELKAANREHELVVREVQRELRRALAPRELARITGHTLLDDAVKTPTGTHRLTDAVSATIECDPRWPCLLIEGCDWVSTSPLPSGDVAEARDFAHAVDVAAQASGAVARQRAQRAGALRARLHDARDDRARIDAAEARLAHLEATAPAAVARLLGGPADEHPAALPA
jgi:hypothetical protein